MRMLNRVLRYKGLQVFSSVLPTVLLQLSEMFRGVAYLKFHGA